MRAFLVILLILIAGGGGWFLGTQYGSPQSTDSASSELAAQHILSPSVPKTIRGQGKFEPASGLIKIVAPLGERIAELTDKPIGAKVELDEILVTLQSRKLREKDLDLAKSRRADALRKAEYEKEQVLYKLASAKLAVDEANAADEKIDSEAQKIRLLERQLEAAERLSNRLQDIQANPTTSDLINQTEIDKQQLLVEQLGLQIEQANLDVEMARESAARAKKVANNNLKTLEYSLENADKATPSKSLEAAIAMAQRAFDMTQIRSPIENATILDIIVRKGDSVTNQPVMILGDTSQMHCVVEVNDQFLSLIEIGDSKDLRAKITSTALKEPLMGTVVSKGIMMGPPSLKDPNPFASVDRRTGTVTIELDDSVTASKFVNLQVEVEIEVEPGNLD